MKKTLLQIADEFEAAMLRAIDRETGEIVDEVAAEEMLQLSMSLDEKLLNCGRYMIGEGLEIQKIDGLIAHFQATKDRHQRHIDWLRGYMAAHCDQDTNFKLKAVDCHIRWTTSQRVDLARDLRNIEGEGLLNFVDNSFVRVVKSETTYSIDKKAAAPVLKEGGKIKGLYLFHHKKLKVTL